MGGNSKVGRRHREWLEDIVDWCRIENMLPIKECTVNPSEALSRRLGLMMMLMMIHKC